MRTPSILALAGALTACGVRHLPPPPAPTRGGVAALTPARPPDEGEGTVTLHTDVPARVDLVVQRIRGELLPRRGALRGAGAEAALVPAAVSVRPLCRTPCAINLPRGEHEIVFSDLAIPTRRESGAWIEVGDRPSILRHRLGAQSASPGGALGAVLLASLGGSAMLVGTPLMIIGGVSDGSGLFVPGAVSLGAGAVTLIGAWILGEFSRPTVRPGSTLQWTP